MKSLDTRGRLGCYQMMRWFFPTLALLTACGGQTAAPQGPAPQETYGVIVPDPGSDDGNKPTQDDRLTMHDGIVLAQRHLRLVYVGTPGVDQAPPVEDFAKWLLTSDYWGTLDQYGVGKGVLIDSVSISTDDFAPESLREPGKDLIAIQDLDARFHALVNGDGTTPRYPGLAGADGYAIFLPNGLNVSLGHRNDYELTTCTDAFGYHAHDGVEAYAVLPPCEKGRNTQAISHELAEMAADPILASGWMSDGDAAKNGGEVADLCDHPAVVEGWTVTQLWSNADGECVPYEK
jgi:hypothetical protein